MGEKKVVARIRRGAKGKAVVWGGLDLSKTVDMTSLCVAWRRPSDGRVGVKHWFWLPEDDIDERSAGTPGARYREWAEQGLLKLTPGPVVDYTAIKDELTALAEKVRIAELSFDPYNAGMLMSELEAEGFKVVEFPQGSKHMSPAVKEVERAIRAGELVHQDHPIMRWQMNQAQVAEDGKGNVHVIKADGGRGRAAKKKYKIDGVIAMVMAAYRCLCATEARRTPYATRGVRRL
jgi:phage terminase large subunit-like protein